MEYIYTYSIYIEVGGTAGRLRLHARYQTKMTAVVLGGALVRAPSGPVSGAKGQC